MAWIKKEADVEVTKELEFDSNRIDVTDAFEVEITEAYLKASSVEGSKSMSLVIGVKTDDDMTNRTHFTIMGQDGNTYFKSTYKGKEVKKQHFGLSIVNTLFMMTLDKEIFDCEPEEVEYEVWNKDDKEMVKETGDGFPELIGKRIGITHQMKREINGKDSKEWGEITHFFNLETGLFNGEEESDNTKLDKWLKNKKEFIVTEVEERKSSFGKKKETEDGEEKPRRKWGNR